MASNVLEVNRKELSSHATKKVDNVKSLPESERREYLKNSAVEDILQTVLRRDEQVRKQGNPHATFKRAVE